jgi:CubicO group peptidase (beta-lactamase class C family)
MDARALTAAFLVIHRGNIIIEEYGPGVTKDTQLESWSMGKSLTATLIGRLIHMGKLTLDQKAPVAEWQREGDPRKEITIRNLLNMSSGLRFPSHHDSLVRVPMAQLVHMYVYTEAINVFDYAVNRPLEFAPGTLGLYRNSDPLTLGYILRTIVEKEGRNYWTWPQEELFDKIGIRRQLLETDPYGNFILSGYDFGTARNWGRIGLLYLKDGVWNGERLLPEGFVDFVSAPAPAWRKPEYGGLFWLNRVGAYSVPEDAYYAAGAGGQVTIIVPSLDLVVVRMGHSDGAAFMDESLNRALEQVVKCVSGVVQ